MTIELEQEFYDTFGIEPLRHVCYRGFDNCIDNDYNCHCHNKKPCKDSHAIYPEITAEKLLEIICMYNCFQNDANSFLIPFDYKDIKNNVLEYLMEEIKDKYKNRYFSNDVEKLKHQIQQLFKD